MDDIRVYTYEQNGRIYERDGSAGDLAGDFRTLNGELAAADVSAEGQTAGSQSGEQAVEEIHSGLPAGEVLVTEPLPAAAE